MPTAEQQAALDRLAQKNGKKTGSQLPSGPPDPGSSQTTLMAWASTVLHIAGDPIETIARFGRHEDARLVITLRSKVRIVFNRQRDMFDAAVLRRKIIIPTGAGMPHYGPPDVQKIATVLVRAADTAADADDRDEARDWACSFLAAVEDHTISVSSTATPAGRWEALCALERAPQPGPAQDVASRSWVVRDDSGKRLVRVADFAAHVRETTTVDWGELHSRMIEIGWQHPGQVQQRQPGGQGKAKARVYVVPAGWDD